MASCSLATFDARKDYREDWRYVDGVEDGVLVRRRPNAEVIESHDVKLLRADVSRPDFQRLGLGLLISPESKVWYLWQLFDADRPDPPIPTIEDVLEFPPEAENGPSVHWLIQQVAEVRHGSMFVLVCTKGRVNAY